MRATVSCCLYTEEPIWARTKHKMSSNIWIHAFGQENTKIAQKEFKKPYATEDIYDESFY